MGLCLLPASDRYGRVQDAPLTLPWQMYRCLQVESAPKLNSCSLRRSLSRCGTQLQRSLYARSLVGRQMRFVPFPSVVSLHYVFSCVSVLVASSSRSKQSTSLEARPTCLFAATTMSTSGICSPSHVSTGTPSHLSIRRPVHPFITRITLKHPFDPRKSLTLSFLGRYSDVVARCASHTGLR